MVKFFLSLCIAVSCIITPKFGLSQGSRKFIGQLIVLDGNRKVVDNIGIKLLNITAGVTNTDGVFTVTIKDTCRFITLKLDSKELGVLAPVGGVSRVPSNQEEVVTFIVGESPEVMLTKAVAKSNNELKNKLADLGVKQDGIEQALTAFRGEIQKLTEIKLSDLKSQIDLDSKRQEFYPELASVINEYINEAKDLKDAFAFTAKHAFEDPQALQLLTESILSYNEVYEKVNKNFNSYEKTVNDLWNEAKATELSNFFGYALGEIHRSNILTLNRKKTEINDYYSGSVKASEKKKIKERITREIDDTVYQLNERLQELDKRARVILSKLAI